LTVPSVAYHFEFLYRPSPAGGMFPILSVAISSPRLSARSADVIAYLDSGAQRSLFDGTLAGLIGIDLMDGTRVPFASAAGFSIEGIIHPVRLSHPELGEFDLDIGFSTVPLRRNLLGRDFFNLVQIGFRERHQVFYVKTEP
jgi:hypothetical protein